MKATQTTGCLDLREERLISVAPTLCRRGIWLDCGPGWDFILMDLFRDLERLVHKSQCFHDYEEDELPVVTQIKEKFGTLRVYLSSETDRMSDLIRDAEALTSQTCEACGNHGKMRVVNRWCSVRCDVCWLKNEEKIVAIERADSIH